MPQTLVRWMRLLYIWRWRARTEVNNFELFLCLPQFYFSTWSLHWAFRICIELRFARSRTEYSNNQISVAHERRCWLVCFIGFAINVKFCLWDGARICSQWHIDSLVYCCHMTLDSFPIVRLLCMRFTIHGANNMNGNNKSENRSWSEWKLAFHFTCLAPNN